LKVSCVSSGFYHPGKPCRARGRPGEKAYAAGDFPREITGCFFSPPGRFQHLASRSPPRSCVIRGRAFEGPRNISTWRRSVRIRLFLVCPASRRSDFFSRPPGTDPCPARRRAIPAVTQFRNHQPCDLVVRASDAPIGPRRFARPARRPKFPANRMGGARRTSKVFHPPRGLAAVRGRFFRRGSFFRQAGRGGFRGRKKSTAGLKKFSGFND